MHISLEGRVDVLTADGSPGVLVSSSLMDKQSYRPRVCNACVRLSSRQELSNHKKIEQRANESRQCDALLSSSGAVCQEVCSCTVSIDGCVAMPFRTVGEFVHNSFLCFVCFDLYCLSDRLYHL